MLRRALARYPGLAKSFEIKRINVRDRTYELVAKITFRDDSRLFIKDYLFRDGTHKYAYHWQEADGALLSRWDNRPHWRSVETFPHHQHNPDGTVGSSFVRVLDDAIAHIARSLE